MDFYSLVLEKQQVKDLALFVRDYAPDLSYSIYVDPNKVIEPLGSRLGGFPYWNFSVRPKFPYNSDGQIMRFIGQINIDDINKAGKSRFLKLTDQLLEKRKILPESGLLQFFTTDDEALGIFDHSSINNRHSYEVIYWPEIPAEDLSITFDELLARFESQKVPHWLISNCCVAEFDYWPIIGEIALNIKASISTPWSSDKDDLIECLEEGFKKVIGQKIRITSYEEFNYMMMALHENKVDREINRITGIYQKDLPLLVGSILGRSSFTTENPFTDLGYASKDYNTTLLVLTHVDRNTVYRKTNGHEKYPRLSFDEASKIFSMHWGNDRHANFFIPDYKLEKKDFSDIFFYWS